ncbi:MAG: response regulator [Arenicella sp.]|nr:response regulator [Arenicella sp.]
MGAADYISKPVQQRTLREVVAKHIPDSLGQFQLLVIDDDEATRSVVRHTFEKLKCTVSEAINGQAGWEQIEELIPDIILLDLMMPKVDGFEFLNRVKRTPEWKDIPVIVLTAKTLTNEDHARLQGRVEKVYEKSEAPLIQILGSVSEQIRSILVSPHSS